MLSDLICRGPWKQCFSKCGSLNPLIRLPWGPMPRPTEPRHFQGEAPAAGVEQGVQEILMHIKAWERLSSSVSRIAGIFYPPQTTIVQGTLSVTCECWGEKTFLYPPRFSQGGLPIKLTIGTLAREKTKFIGEGVYAKAYKGDSKKWLELRDYIPS